MTLGKFQIVWILFLLISAISAETNYTAGQIIFKTNTDITLQNSKLGLTAFDNFLSSKGLKSIQPIKGMPGNKYFIAKLSQMPDIQLLKDGSYSFPGIEYIQPNYLRKFHAQPNDPLYLRQFMNVSNIPQAWNYTTGSKQIIVGIIDSGVLIHHPDLAANIYINPNEIPDNGIDDDGNGYIDDWCGWDFADAPEMADTALGDFMDQDNDVTDENFHGTHVAGIIGARGNNGIGIAGTCWDISMMPIRAGFRTIQGQGYLQDDDAAAAIIYAADNGCHVVNMSWGDPSFSAIIADACDYAHSKGVVLVASSGNDPVAVLSYPAKLSSVISVGSVNSAKVLSGFSSYGYDLDLVAVGESVLSTYKNDGVEMYFEQSGTSMSAPFVTGSIALLLSLVPGLSPAEVRARLLSSTDDLGATGYDFKYGHGLLNTQKLIENTNPPFVQIDSPIDHLAISETSQITGSVYGQDFARYTLMYRSISDPTMSDWKDALRHTSQPEYYKQEVVNGVLGEFYIPSSFPEGTYMLRLQFEKTHNNTLKYSFFRTIIVDRSIPILRPEKLSGFKRYDKQNLRYYIAAGFNEPVRSVLNILASDGSEHIVYGTLLDSLQVWALPTTLPQGSINIRITATNLANLSLNTPIFSNILNIQYGSVPTYGYTRTQIGKARVPLSRQHDFNGNGTKEYVAMDVPIAGYGQVYTYEPYSSSHVTTNWFVDAFWPLDIGNTNSQGMEMLLLKADNALLWETPMLGHYPSKDSLIWSDTSITGGIMADYDRNGTTDILLVKNLPLERVIQLYTRHSSGVMVARNTLRNTTATTQRNNFVPSIIVENLDLDLRPDILCADTDGDLMIFEVASAAEATMTWTTRLPISNTYQMASGDFNGDGTKDFIVGGYSTNIINQNLNFWYFEGFTTNGNNSYTSMGNIMFNTYQSQNAITAIDLDGDGKDEVILGISPNLYVLKYINGSFMPVFYGESFMNYRLAAWKDNTNKAWFMTNYKVSADSTVAVHWTLDEPYTGPATPVNFNADPTSDSTARISWIDQNADYYRIYRKTGSAEPVLIDLVTGSVYEDTNLVEGQAYSYAVTAVHQSFSPPESKQSAWITITPYRAPMITDIVMVSNRELRLLFNQNLPASALNPSFFSISPSMGNPLSVNSTIHQTGLQLSFRESFPAIDSLFVLSIRGLAGNTGVFATTTSYTFAYSPDIEAPRIQSVSILPSKKAVEVILSENIVVSSALYLGNYTLNCPANDPDNSIVSVSCVDNRIIATLRNPLRHSDQAYYIRIENITDLAGNRISPQYNLARFAIREINNLKDVKVYPNPVRRVSNSEIVFLNFPPGKTGKIALYDASGALVYKSSIGPFLPENNRVTWRWNLQNTDGQKVSSGVYFYVIEMDSETTRGKFAVIN